MATIISQTTNAVQSERTFFFGMAIAIAATAVIGFSFAHLMGNSSFGAPWWVHVHAVTMMGWITLYLVQNALVWRGNLAFHRQLGILGLAWSIWMVPVGIGATMTSLSAHRVPPFFNPSFFLVMDALNILVFAVIIWAGIVLRERQDWHKRLMLGGTIAVLGPAWGRLLPLPLLGNAVVWPILVILLLYFGVAMIYDLRKRGKIHPAYYWGAGAMTLFVLAIGPIASVPTVIAYTATLTG